PCYPVIVLETAVNSFVLRFVQESATSDGEPEADWHGIIRHVQSNTELRFVQIDEALAFIATYVPLQQAPLPKGPADNG
ncbi:MAG: hypothetical protein R3C44_24160, partial [Chloroflexota bacterium]